MDGSRGWWQRLLADASLSGLIAGFIMVIVGMTSSAVLVFQAASSANLSPQEASSWLGSLCLGMGIITVILSIKYRTPILIAWSTAGAALLVSGLKEVPLPDAVGAFIFSAFLIFLSGVTGIFDRMMNRIPIAMASALLGGVLVHFSMDSFVGFKTQPALVGTMLLTYLLGKRFLPRWTMLLVLLAGIVVGTITGSLRVSSISVAFTEFHLVMPRLSGQALLSLGVPLFIVTMASQNLTGLTVMRVNGFPTPVSALMTWTGITNMLTAPLGGFAINLAAITAAIGMGPEAHPDHDKRYFSGVVSGLCYIVIGIFAGTVTSLFAAFPSEMVTAIAGLALLGTIAGCLQSTLADNHYKESAFITFVVSASGMSLFGIGSAFWGLLIGILAQLILRKRS